jgi:transcriptional regulator with XRE-family HTH domain
MTLGYKLAKLRKEHNYTQEQLAAVLGVSRQSVSKWESDLAYPETDKLIRLSELFDCSLDYLLKGAEDGVDVSSCENITDIQVDTPDTSHIKRKIIRALAIILLFVFIGVIYCQWNNLFYEFGRNIYRWLH